MNLSAQIKWSPKSKRWGIYISLKCNGLCVKLTSQNALLILQQVESFPSWVLSQRYKKLAGMGTESLIIRKSTRDCRNICTENFEDNFRERCLLDKVYCHWKKWATLVVNMQSKPLVSQGRVCIQKTASDGSANLGAVPRPPLYRSHLSCSFSICERN